MDGYLREYNEIINELVNYIFDNSNYGLPQRFLDIIDETEIINIHNKLKNKIKMIIFERIGCTTYDFIEKNAKDGYKRLNIQIIMECGLKNIGQAGHFGIKKLQTTSYGYHEMYIKPKKNDDLIYNPKNKEAIKICYQKMKKLELTIIDVLRSESNNNYFCLTPKDITNEITKYLL